MKKGLAITLLIFSFVASDAHADIWGADVAVLAQILQQTIQQLIQLKEMVSTAQDSLGLLENINKGINDSLSLLHTVAPDFDPGIYKQVETIKDALGQVVSIYGQPVPSEEFTVQSDTDKEVAEAIILHNQVFDYSKTLDDIGDQISRQSHNVSPGGAQKLTAQALGVMLHTLSASNRIQGTSLKIQAQQLEIQNHKDKVETDLAMKTSSELEHEMANSKIDFSLPRF
jgi:hypothetical protein